MNCQEVKILPFTVLKEGVYQKGRHSVCKIRYEEWLESYRVFFTRAFDLFRKSSVDQYVIRLLDDGGNMILYIDIITLNFNVIVKNLSITVSLPWSLTMFYVLFLFTYDFSPSFPLTDITKTVFIRTWSENSLLLN